MEEGYACDCTSEVLAILLSPADLMLRCHPVSSTVCLVKNDFDVTRPAQI